MPRAVIVTGTPLQTRRWPTFLTKQALLLFSFCFSHRTPNFPFIEMFRVVWILITSAPVWGHLATNAASNIGINHVIIAPALTYGSGMGDINTDRSSEIAADIELRRTSGGDKIQVSLSPGQVSNTGQHLPLGLSTWHYPDTIVNCSLHQGLTPDIPMLLLFLMWFLQTKHRGYPKHCSTFADFALRITSPWCYATLGLGLVSRCVQSSPKHWQTL